MPHTDTAFVQEYDRLNDAQRQAVDAIDGPVMVLAGPGTGKTQILALRIANIVRTTDTSPDAILALTFTESAALNMRQRLTRIMGSRAYEVNIHTFHGLAQTLITKYPENFPQILGSTLANDVDQLRIAERILRRHTGKHIRWYDTTNRYVTGLIGAIDVLKREYISPEILEAAVTAEESVFADIPDLYHDKGAHKGKMKSDYQDLQKRIEKNRELVALYRAYLTEMTAEKLYDFTDMLQAVVQACESDQDFLMQLQEEFQYILVDEHQDTNTLQNRLVALIGSFFESPNIFVVGDDKQSIYRFQGASPEYFYGFTNKYPTATVISLTHNYRSRQRVLDMAHSLLPSDTGLVAAHHTEHEAELSLCVYPSAGVECFGVGEKIQQLIHSNVPAHEIAIITRTNDDTTGFARELTHRGIPFRIESDADILSEPFIQNLLAVFRSIMNPDDEVSLSRVLYQSWVGISSLDASRIVRASSHKRKKTLIEILGDEAELNTIGVNTVRECKKLHDQILIWHRSAQTEHCIEVFNTIIKTTQIVANAANEKLEYQLSLLQVLFADIESFASRQGNTTFCEYMSHLETLVQHGRRLKLYTRGGQPGHVRIMTAHRAKGLEFQFVFIPLVVDKKWGHRADQDPIKILDRVFDALPDNDSDADERRLLYVALTRAQYGIFISYPTAGDDGREYIGSQFLADLDQSLVTMTDESGTLERYSQERIARLFADPVTTSDRRTEFHAYLMRLLDERPFAATHLNNYLADPWQYIFRNLIRIPEIQGSALLYGSAVHKAIEMLYIQQQKTGTTDIQGAMHAFTECLEHSPIGAADFERLVHQGDELLHAWYQTHQGLLVHPGISEYRINGITVPGLNITLSGQIDRLEFIDGSDVRVRVIDWKTGKPKTRNDILGVTKTGDGNYYRQLQFYKLLLRYFQDGRYEMEEGIVHFVEQKPTGGFVSERFVIPESEVDALEQTLQTVESELRSGAYWDREPDPKKCDYGDLVAIVRGV